MERCVGVTAPPMPNCHGLYGIVWPLSWLCMTHLLKLKKITIRKTIGYNKKYVCCTYSPFFSCLARTHQVLKLRIYNVNMHAAFRLRCMHLFFSLKSRFENINFLYHDQFSNRPSFRETAFFGILKARPLFVLKAAAYV